jgi:8-oxo-dGTP pyrophosphatase MutT (NUDIX family)
LPQRDARLQAAVVRDKQLLILEMLIDDGRRFWLLPGGGREVGDLDQSAAVAREVREEVGIEVTVVRKLVEVAAHPDDARYRRYCTFLCHARPDSEPLVGIRDGIAQIVRARWLPLENVAEWGGEICADRFLLPQLQAIREALHMSDTAHE